MLERVASSCRLLARQWTAQKAQFGTQLSLWHWTALLTSAAAAGCATHFMASHSSTALMHALEEEERQRQLHEQLHSWLEQQGADLSGVQLQGAVGDRSIAAGPKPAKSRHCTRLAKAYDWVMRQPAEICLATFPLSEAFTVRNIITNLVVGPGYQRAAEGMMDERELIMLALMTERLKGSASPWASWIASLPKTFDTPVFYSDAELEELKGTNLHHAARLLKKQLTMTWQRLGAACKLLLREEGIKCQPPSLHDLIWAYSIFWSRGQAIPTSLEAGAEVEEGLVPGLDMCNHASPAPARWKLQAAKQPGARPSEILLMVERPTACRPGAEVAIDYGDKSNEELLLLYGFCTDTRNVNDQLMIPLLSTASVPDDPIIHARLALLEQHGCTAQVFLPSWLTQKASSAQPATRQLCGKLTVPHSVLSTLQIWCMSPQQMAQELSKQHPADLDEPEASLQADMLDLLVHLLSQTTEHFEGSEGTGSLEADIRLLDMPQELPVRLKNSVIYRASQKRLARAFLSQAIEALPKLDDSASSK